MKNFVILAMLGSAAVLASSCTDVGYSGSLLNLQSRNGPNSLTSSGGATSGTFTITANPTSAEVNTTDSQNFSVADLNSGQMYSFTAVSSSGAALTHLVCTGFPSGESYVSGNVISVDTGITALPQGDTLSANCTSDQGAFNLDLTLANSTFALVSSSLLASPAALMANSTSTPGMMTPDEQYVVFESMASNLVPGTSGQQIYRKNLLTGALDLVSSTDGTASQQGNGVSENPVVSSDGRYVVFASNATNLVSGTSGYQVFRKDMVSGSMTLVSSIDGTVANQASGGVDSDENPQITSDGRYVVFCSTATNLVSHVISQPKSVPQVYRKDMASGTIDMVSATASTFNGVTSFTPTNHGAGNLWPRITDNGQWVSFTSTTTAGSPSQVYLKDMVAGTVTLVSAKTNFSSSNEGSQASTWSDLSQDGRFIFFASTSTNLATGLSGSLAIFRKDMQTGALTLASADTSGQVNVYNPSSEDISNAHYVSATGQYIVFTAETSSGGNSGFVPDVFRKDMGTGELVVVSSTDSGTSNELAGNFPSLTPSISSDGTWILFASQATNLLPGISALGIPAQVLLKNLP